MENAENLEISEAVGKIENKENIEIENIEIENFKTEKPKTENMEIEKKYLINEPEFDKFNFKPDNYKCMEIEQSYISVSPVIRIRRSNDQYILTLKGPGNIIRKEFELDISIEQYNKLMRKMEGGTIFKTRYIIPLESGHIAELDIYHGELKGLKTVEVEFDSVAALNSFEPPKWFGRDVSKEHKYSNSSLAMSLNIVV